MSEQVLIDIFKFGELSTSAQEAAANHYREHWMHDWWDSTFEDFNTIAECLGYTIERTPRTTTKGRTYEEPHIWFSGFSSQGDGASFEGRLDLGALLHAPTRVADYAGDGRLRAIAEAMKSALVEACNALSEPAATTLKGSHVTFKNSSGHYCHARMMDINCERVFEDIAYELGDKYHEFDKFEVLHQLEKTLLEQARTLADWLYKTLEDEYEYQSSLQQIAEHFDANEVRFTSDGRIFRN